jgi:hypothetical protein
MISINFYLLATDTHRLTLTFWPVDPDRPKNVHRFAINTSLAIEDTIGKLFKERFRISTRYLIEQSGSFSRHARAGGHPAFSAEHFWIPACAGMTSFE